MAKGDVYASEISSFVDSETGVAVQRLTNHLCHSNHLYFTHWAYYAGGRRMLFHSDRGNAHNLFGMDLETGEIRQLTEFGPDEQSPGPFSAVVSRARDEAYFWVGNRLHSLDLTGLTEVYVWEAPPGVRPGTPNCSADGAFVYFTLNEDLSERLKMDLARGYVGFEEYWEAHPHCAIWRVPAGGGEAELVWEEDNWLGHVNCSPVGTSLLTFCHEGPWTKVDHRIWGMDTRTGNVWRMRPDPENAVVGHEYWFADGSRVGYHGRPRAGGAMWGHADPAGGDWIDYPLTRGSMHFCSPDDKLVVGDGGRDDPYLILWRRIGEQLEARLLCRHRGSFHTQRVHVHPTFTPGGRAVIFTADLGDYGQIYRIDVPEFSTLPEA